MAVGGEGGMITTTKLDLVNRMQRFVDHGRDKDLEAIELTSNLRMSEVQAAIGRIQLTKVEGWVERRREIAHQFDFSAHERPNTQHSWHQYCILSDEPQNLISRMDAAEIDARVYYPLPCHRQAVFSNHEQYNTELAVTDEIAPRLVAIPVHPFLTEAEIERIIKAVNG